jgi:hypothetical protein
MKQQQPTPNKDLSPYANQSEHTGTHLNNRSHITGGFAHHERDRSAIKLQGVNQSVMVNPVVPDQSINNSGHTQSRHEGFSQRPLDVSKKSNYNSAHPERIGEEVMEDDDVHSERHSKNDRSHGQSRIGGAIKNEGGSSGNKDLESPDAQHHNDSLLGR